MAGKRKTSEFSVYSAEHQQLVLESLESRLAGESLKWKKARLSWLIRRVNQSLEVHRRKRHAV
jgi:hypothetical protein